MAKKTWIIKGKLKLKDLPAVYRDGANTVPLSGVTVKISANEGIRWNSWGTVTTDSDGAFVMRKKKDKSKRKIRVEVQFKNSKTVVYGENSSLLSKLLTTLKPVTTMTNATTQALDAILDHTSRLTYKADWHTLKESSKRNTGGGDYEFDYGNITIGKHSSGYLFEHACIFFGCEKLRKHLSAMGHIFKKKIAVKFPHDNKLIADKIENAYCSPINNCVYLIKNSRLNSLYDGGEITFNTLYHELMHLWAYGYSKGEDKLAWQLMIHGSTHEGIQAKSFTAFHEAWAEVSSNLMLKNIFGEFSDVYGGFTFYVFPFYKPSLQNMGIQGISNVDRNEYGWMHIFNTLMCDNLINFNTSLQQENATTFAKADQRERDDIPSLDIYDLMNVFRVPEPFTTKEMNVDNFMDRVQRVEPNITHSVRSGYLKVFDPSNLSHPKDCF